MNARSRFLTRTILFALFVGGGGVGRSQETLSEDKRVATLGDVQGIVTVKSPTAERWSLARPERLLSQGDWLRTDVRGANAVRAVLSDGARLVLGPGTMMELGETGSIKLIRGEVEITPAETASIQLNGQEISKPGVWRAAAAELVLLKSDPLWLTGFKGVMTTEAMGSLVAKVDGRDVPLTVGYHKVSVEIRDQIARTTIEESFVNHTKSRTEGVFYFPLPQEASISGFAMWIGNELVEADVVEKQRAREIYETILRERRDPGLLEWAGGNLFKARVFPIEPHSEKRIKITYTQVLPLDGGVYRYRYGLQSEMLRLNPVRELQIEARIYSANGVESVSCLTHPGARVETTEKAASVRFEAQEYSPDRDFEIAVTPKAAASPVTMIPHRRGEDGYFLAMLRIPELSRAAETASDEPIDLIILADTSGSMDDAQRAVQAEIVSALLNQLGERDRFNLALCDIAPAWWSAEARPVTGESMEQVRAFLDGRVSMGWSDLGKAFAGAMEKAGPKTQVIYLGDGIPATAATDPVAFADRLKRAHLKAGGKGTFHAIATGSLHEAGVMKSIASLGGGSFRKIGGSDTPASVAAALMEEMARPGYRDLRVSFEGIRTARVYPEVQANVPPGSQRIVAGRYLPTGKAQKGEIVISGRLGENAVEWRFPVAIEDGEEGNSFVPRLWARQHLDNLLEQGATPEIREEIVGMSEEFKIMTPYTSFLVLESEADRERFKVKRRFQMRGGEEFFTEGTEEARYELVRAQLQRAAAWRQNIRARMLAELKAMGRRASGRQFPIATDKFTELNELRFAMIGHGGVVGSRYGNTVVSSDRIRIGGGFTRDSVERAYPFESLGDYDEPGSFAMNQLHEAKSSWELPMPSAAPAPASESFFSFDLNGSGEWFMADFQAVDYEGDAFREVRFGAAKSAILSDFRQGGRKSDFSISHQSGGGANVLDLFPKVANSVGKPDGEADEIGWPEEAKALDDSLLRLEALQAGPFEATVSQTHRDVRRDGVSFRGLSRVLARPGHGWLAHLHSPDAGGSIEWVDGEAKQRGFFDSDRGLGRTRASVEDDFDDYLHRIDLPYGMLKTLRSGYGHWEKVTVDDAGDGTSWLEIVTGSGKHRQRFRIDREKKLVVGFETWIEEKRTLSVKMAGTQEFAGTWWPKAKESFDGEGHLISRVEYQFRGLDGANLTAEMTAALKPIRDGVVLGDLPGLVEARRRIEMNDGGAATPEDWMMLVLRHSASQEWDEVEKNLGRFANSKWTDAQIGLRWIWLRHFMLSRQMEKARTAALVDAAEIARREPVGDAVELARLLAAEMEGLAPGESLELWKALRPAFERAAGAAGSEWRMALQAWRSREAQLMDSWPGATDAARLEKWRSLAADYDFDLTARQQAAGHLWSAGERDAARAFVEGQLDRDDWIPQERWMLRDLLVRWLEEEGRYAEAAAALEKLTGDEGVTSNRLQGYLQNLLWSGQQEKHDATLRLWARETIEADGALDDIARQRAYAAIQEAQGQGRGRSWNFVPVRWEILLAEMARDFIADPDKVDLASSILNDWRFQQLDAWPAIRKEVGVLLREQGAGLTIPHLGYLIGWGDLKADDWKKLSDQWIARWRNEKKPREKQAWGDFLSQHGAQFGDPERFADFLRERLAGSSEADRPARAAALFQQVLGMDLTKEVGNEAYGLLIEIIPSAGDLSAGVTSLLKLNDHVFNHHRRTGWEAVENPNELSRDETREIQKRLVKEAREAVVVRLEKESGRLGNDPRFTALRPWLELEKMYQLALLDREPKALLARCLEWLGDTPAAWFAKGGEADAMSPTERARLVRVLETALFLLSKHSAEAPVETARLEAFLAAGAKIEDSEIASSWRRQLWRLRIALDQVEPLEKNLREWVAAEPLNPEWKQALGYLLAETNRLAEAVGVFEALAEEKMLGGAEYAALAGWYQALDRKEDHERAKFRGLRASNEQQLNQHFDRLCQRVQSRSGGSTGELTDDEIEKLTALFATARQPEQYYWHLQNLYRETKDHRLPGTFASGVIGRSAREIYRVLERFGDLSRMIEEEASVDAAIKEINRLRDLDVAESAADRRALDLLEAELKRRASEVLNQPGQPADEAVAAMKRAFERDWSEGERRLMASWLQGLGRASREAVRAEMMREFAALHAAEPDPMGRLEIAHQWGISLMNHGENQEAVERLTAALEEARQAGNGLFIAEMQNAFHQLLIAHWNSSHHRDAERAVRAELARSGNVEMTYWIKTQLFETYRRALEAGTATDLGEKAALFQNVRIELLKEIAADAESNHRYAFVTNFCQIHLAAASAKIEGVADGLIEFAHKQLPEFVRQDEARGNEMVNHVADTIKALSGPGKGLEFLVAMIEQEPVRRRLAGNSIWIRAGYDVSRWRSEAGDQLGADLEKRTLAVMIDWLDWALETREMNYLEFGNVDSGHAWNEKIDEFCRVAEAYLERNRNSTAAVMNGAGFLFDYPNRYGRACDLLLGLHGEKRLDENGRSTLGNYLETAARWEDSERIHRELIADHPAGVDYRVRLVRSLSKQERKPDAAEALSAAEEWFRNKEKGGWNEANVAALAGIALETNQFERAAALYGEAIPMVEKSRPNRGVGEGTVSNYYRWMAQAYGYLGKTREAVDAASAAIVAWGPRFEERRQDIDTLRNILSNAADLDDYVKILDAAAAERGLEKPIVRKAAGEAYLGKQQYAEAVKQLRIAVETQPDDAETHRKLIEALDGLGDEAAARAQLVASIRLAPRELSLFRELAGREEKAGNAFESERARTGLVEAMPNEAEGHAALAEIREERREWEAAIAHWRRVAELRELEPVGLIGVARSQAKSGSKAAAESTLADLKSRHWPSRFDSEIREGERSVREADPEGR